VNEIRRGRSLQGYLPPGLHHAGSIGRSERDSDTSDGQPDGHPIV